MRNHDALELARRAPNAFRLAYFIAYRARWNNGFNADNLQPGEALLGDYKTYGMTEQEYRTAKCQLMKWNFATFKATNRGTVARLIDTRLFFISDAASNELTNTQRTDSQRTANEQTTTNYKGIENKERVDAKDAGAAVGIAKYPDEAPALTQSQEFQIIWQRYLTHRVRIGFPPTESVKRRDLYVLERFPLSEAMEILNEVLKTRATLHAIVKHRKKRQQRPELFE